MAISERLEKLQQMLQREPGDAFLLYSIGMEHKKLNEPDKAIEFFDGTIKTDPGYCYAYYQKGQLLDGLNKPDEAKRVYREGIEAAKKKGDAHAQSELETALSMIE